MRLKEGHKEKDIIEAAIKVFAEFGYHNAKISTIAKKANVATGSVYVYYKNKEDILFNIFDKLWQELFEKLRIVSDNNSLEPEEKVELMVDMVFEVFSGNPSLAVVFVNEQNNIIRLGEYRFNDYYEKFLDIAEAVMKEGIAKGNFRKEIDLNVFRNFIFGAIRYLLHVWAADPKKIGIKKISSTVKNLLLHGIK